MPVQAFYLTYNGMPVALETGVPPPADLMERIKRDFPGFAPFMDIPEIGTLLVQAAQQRWDSATLQAELIGTDWWKATSEATRKWEALVRTDPATAETKRVQQTAAISELATKLGASIGADTARHLADERLRLGWSDTQVKSAIMAHVDWTAPGTGAVGTTKLGLKQLAGDYLVAVTDDQVNQWTRGVMEGSQSEDTYKQFLIGQAKSLYPHLTAALDRGETTRQYADQYRALAARRLNIPEASIDLNDPKWKRPLMQVDPETGDRVAMSLDEWDRLLREDRTYGWEFTKEAIDGAYQWISDFGRAMGKKR